MPCAILGEVCEKQPRRMQALAFLENLEKGQQAHHRLYFDFKKGVTLRSLFATTGNTSKSLLDEVGERGINQICRDTKSCVAPSACTCEIMPGFGDQLLENSWQKLNEKTTAKIQQSLCPLTQPHWKDIGILVFSWCCATGVKQRT